MKIYLYDEVTLIYKGEKDARIDELASKYEKKDVYLKPLNATFTPIPELAEGQTAKYNKETDSWVVITSNIGNYIINTKLNTVSKIVEDKHIHHYEIIISEEQYKDLMANPDKYEVRDNELVDISGTQSYQNKVNIAKYEDLIRAAKEKYDLFLSSPVKYSGSYYLPRYLDDYEKLQFRAFPQEIWDAKGTSSKLMTKNDFIGLKTFLEDLVNKAYKEKKETIKKYKLAIKKLEGK